MSVEPFNLAIDKILITVNSRKLKAHWTHEDWTHSFIEKPTETERVRFAVEHFNSLFGDKK